MCVCVCVCPSATPTWFLVDVGGEQPISSLLSVWTGEVELPKVGHVKDGHAMSAREALALNLNGNTLAHVNTNPHTLVCALRSLPARSHVPVSSHSTFREHFCSSDSGFYIIQQHSGENRLSSPQNMWITHSRLSWVCGDRGVLPRRDAAGSRRCTLCPAARCICSRCSSSSRTPRNNHNPSPSQSHTQKVN